MKAQLLMESKGVKFEVIDIADPNSEDAKIFMQKNADKKGARHPVPPQFFQEDEYCGVINHLISYFKSPVVLVPNLLLLLLFLHYRIMMALMKPMKMTDWKSSSNYPRVILFTTHFYPMAFFYFQSFRFLM